MKNKGTSKDTNIEIKVRSFLLQKGLRFRKNVKDLPGRPDIVLPKHKTVIFVHGCFWHQHTECKKGRIRPKTNIDFWTKKLDRNIKRDKETKAQLEKQGWKVIVIWECELDKQNDPNRKLNSIYQRIITS